jgi:hypothetical protein
MTRSFENCRGQVERSETHQNVLKWRTKFMTKKSIFSNEWNEYGASIIFVLMLPLLPILFEWLVSYKIATSSLTIMASFYAIAVGVSSYDRKQFWVGSIICVIFAGIFGLISQNNTLSLSLPSIVLVILLLIASMRGILVMLNRVILLAISILIGTVLIFLVSATIKFDSPFFSSLFWRFAAGSILVMFIWHAIERYHRHLVDCEPFWIWSNDAQTGER